MGIEERITAVERAVEEMGHRQGAILDRLDTVAEQGRESLETQASAEAHAAEREAAAGWRPAAPTEAELLAHHAAHATAKGLSLWLFWPAADARPCILGATRRDCASLLLWWSGPGRWQGR